MTAGPGLSNQTPLTADGNVRPNRVLCGVAGTPFAAVESPDGSKPPLGVSEGGQRFVAGSPANDGFIAIAGETIAYRGPGQRASVLVGTAITDVTKPVVAYTDGTYGAGCVKPVSFAGGQTTGIWQVGFPEDTAAAGELVPVTVAPIFYHPALS